MKLLWRAYSFFLIFTIGSCSGVNTPQIDRFDELAGTDFEVADIPTYERGWQIVDSLDGQGLPKSALKVVNHIYQKAKLDRNSPQLIKSIFYRNKYFMYLVDEAEAKVIGELEQEVAGSVFPEKAILQSALAELYWQFYEKNEWKFLDRTETVYLKDDDIYTWDLRKILKTTISLYEASLSDPPGLKKIAIGPYEPVLVRGSAKHNLRPSLFDFLAHRAVDFFRNDKIYLTEPAYKFHLDDPSIFEPSEDFSKAVFTTKDSLSQHFRALTILQSLVRFHLEDAEPDALIDVELKRLAFAFQHAVGFEDKDSRYLEALKALEKKHIGSPASTEISYTIANEYFRRSGYGGNYEKDTQWARKTAHEICQAASKRFPKSDGAKNCLYLISRIEEKSLALTSELVTVPAQPSRSLVRYQNISTLFFRVVKLDAKQEDDLRTVYGKKLITEYRKMKAVEAWTVELPNPGDFRQHTVEIVVPALPPGNYVLLAGTDPEYAVDNNAVAYTGFWVSNISYFSRTDNNRQTFKVVHRATGIPLVGVTAQTWYEKYDYDESRYVVESGEKYTTDQTGTFEIVSDGNHNYWIEFLYQADRLATRDYYYGYKWNEPADIAQVRTFFFTDRSIYRPGQTIYFKGVVLKMNMKKSEILPNRKTVVKFYDVNYELISSLPVKTNEYGSFSGSFTAPKGGLNGTMEIVTHDESGYVSFRVEEYKRPKFEVTFDPVKESFQLEDVVKIDGSATAYAGSNIDNATVTYRVVRATSFPYWWWSWGRYPSVSDVEIKNGETTTDKEGKFEIEFTALPDPKVKKDQQPVFNYTVYADVTDINGETHSSSTTVRVGYVGLQIAAVLPEVVNQKTFEKAVLTSQNLNGEYEPSAGTFEITPLKAPAKVFRKRLWTQPEFFVIPMEEFYKTFPNDVYDKEDDFHHWEKGPAVFTGKFDTDQSKDIILNGMKNWSQGRYLFDLKTKDKFGNDIRLQKYFTVYGPDKKTPPLPEIAWYSDEKTSGEPGESAVIAFGSAEKIQALVEVEHDGRIVDTRTVKIDNSKQRIEIPIKESYRGGFSVHITFVRHSRFYSKTKSISVPWTNKQLNFEFMTFRDKLKPGEPEEWKIKISGSESEKVAAEMLAGMYDASLDAFVHHGWGFNILPYGYSSLSWEIRTAFSVASSRIVQSYWNKRRSFVSRSYDALNWFDFSLYSYYGSLLGKGLFEQEKASSRMGAKYAEPAEGASDLDALLGSIGGIGAGSAGGAASVLGAGSAAGGGGDLLEAANGLIGLKDAGPPPPPASQKNGSPVDFSAVKVRANLDETAFFYPHLETNENGEVIISFTTPEALTRWNLLGFAHTKSLSYGMFLKSVVTQKELMMFPNTPRFLREGDRITVKGKISNLTDKELSGDAVLQLFDALTMNPVDDDLGNGNAARKFTAPAGQSAVVSWDLEIPSDFRAITYRMIAQSGEYSDGEENSLPVLTNRMLVTESLPLPVRDKGSRSFEFTKLVSSNSPTLEHEKLTLEFTSNPAWFAVQALPYLMEFPYECSEQVFSRFYANSLATHIANSSPKIKNVFASWRETESDELLSNLEKNQELKSLLLEETPWVFNAGSETERKKRVALLFDLNKMADELNTALTKLQNMQVANGGWPWFPGMPESRYITQHVVSGMGKLGNLKVKNIRSDNATWKMIKGAVAYLDREMQDDYDRLVKSKVKLEEKRIGQTQIQYLYARSFFKDIPLDKNHQTAHDYWVGQAERFWLSENLYMQGMIALALNRLDRKNIPGKITKSIKEFSLSSDELGNYWKENGGGYYWYQAPIETQALLIEVFDEVANDQPFVDGLKVWLLKQKQVQDWKTTKATVEACYALLLRGTEWLEQDTPVEISLGGKKVFPLEAGLIPVEAGTGYFKTSWPGKEIVPEMGNVQVNKKTDGVSWGALYWQYFEQLDKITPHETPLKLEKALFVERPSDTGPVLVPIDTQSKVSPGDLIKVRIELLVDRTMEYVHMKDMRASGLEPVDVLSAYQYQGGLGYYQSTKDASTNFFLSYLPKGTFVFEYGLRVTHGGDFSNGITTIQSMYAPEFTSHSEGIRLQVK